MSRIARLLTGPCALRPPALWLLLLLLTGGQAQAAVDFTISTAHQTYVGGVGVQPVDAQATVQGDDFTQATLRVAIAAGGVPSEDILQVLTRSPILIASGGTISVALGASVVIGSYSGGTAGSDLVIALNASATPSLVVELLHSVSYFNLAGPTPTIADRTVTWTMTKAAVATVVQSRVIEVGLGNSLPGVTTNNGLTVGRSQFADLRGQLITTDANDAASLLTYALRSLPTHGRLIRKNTTAGTSPTVLTTASTFTQENVDDGLIAYENQGDAATSDTFEFQVSDQSGATTPVTGVAITITGTFSNPVITLPGPLRSQVEDAAATALVDLVDTAAAGAILGATVSDGDSPHYRLATLEVAFLTAGGVDDHRGGDQLAITSTPGPLVDGSITVSGGAISYRLAGSDHALATVDAQFTGAGGVMLRLNLLNTLIVGSAVSPSPYQISEVITPAAVARLIERITFRSTDQDPSPAGRLLRVTLAERTPDPGLGSAAATVVIMPVNDAPTFVMPATATTSLMAVSGIVLPITLLASDPDSPSPGYALVSKDVPDSDATVLLDPASGACRFTPIAPYVGTAHLVISASDTLGGTAQVAIDITTIATPATANRPFITSDPPLEIEEGGSLLHNLTILPDPTLGTLQSVTLAFIGQLPAGLNGTQLGTNASIWTLTTAPLARPSLGSYSFGVLVTTVSAGGSAACYQPITLCVRALGAAD
jgi:hypothetical protein